MPSSLKTANLGLNSWVETDKPTRADFVSDNAIIDNKLGSHLTDTTVHLSEAEKLQVDEPYIFKMLQGTGEDTRTLSLDFTPRMVIYFAAQKPPMQTVDGVTTIYNAVAAYGYESSGGIGIGDKRVVILSETSDGVKYDLNNIEIQYVLVIFR